MTGNQATISPVARLAHGKLKLDGPAFRKGVPLAIASVWLCSLVLYAGTRVPPSDANHRARIAPALVARLLAVAPRAVEPSNAGLMDNPASPGMPPASSRPAVARTPPAAPFVQPGTVTTPSRLKHTTRQAHAKAATHTAQVWVTGYNLVGSTAMGTQTGPGVCAVDPSFIPLGTRIAISGVGNCTALDTGPAVAGAHIDVWVADYQTALNLTGWYTATWR